MELIKGVRGTKDIFGKDGLKYNFIAKSVEKFFDNYGFEMIKTPIFEETLLFKRGVGEGTDIVDKEMYTFTDRGDRSLTLRPEGTAPVVRSYLENKIYATEEITRYYYMGQMFRYERPQSGRQREFNQIGIEVLGESSPILDAEVIAMSYKLLEKFKITDLEVKINCVGEKETRIKYRENLLKFLEPIKNELCPDCQNRMGTNPLRVLDCKIPKCKELTEKAPSIISDLSENEREHFETVKKYLEIFGVKYIEDSRLVRGLDYYSSTVYEIVTNKLGAQGTVLGGGRYDNLLKQLGDKEIPAFGFAAGVERIMMLIDDEIVPTSNPKVYIAWLGDSTKEFAMKVAEKFRNLDIKTAIDFKEKNLKSHLKKAEKLEVEYVMIVGEDEFAKEIYILKDFKNREQYELPLKDIEDVLIDKED
ncbi:MAG: histidine--tRNA ligase [Fusobacteriaceae bacterium]